MTAQAQSPQAQSSVTAAKTRRPQLPLSPTRAIIFGMAVLTFGFGGFATWAAIAPLESAVISTGRVAVDSSRKKVQHPDGGVIAALLVREGDRVTAGQVLLRLDQTRARATLSILEGEQAAALAEQTRLIAERDGLEVLQFPNALITRSYDPEVVDTLAGQESLFEARRASLEGETTILDQRVRQLGDEVKGLAAQAEAKARQLELIEDELIGLRNLFSKGLTPRSRILALEREAAKIQGERSQLISDRARIRKSIGETKMQILQRETQFRESVVAELRRVEQRLFDLEERIAAARHVVQHIELRSPVSGKVVGLKVHTLGGVIGPGDTVMEIVPEDDRLIVEARVQPLDIDTVAPGQEADVRIVAFRMRTTPILLGQVAWVSADALQDNRTGEPYYLARVEITDEEVRRLEQRRLHPGMPAEVMIKTGSRTPFEYLAQPFIESANRAWRED